MIFSSHASKALFLVLAALPALSHAALRQVMLENATLVPNTGWSVSSAGDVNGDGFDDILVGSNATTGSGTMSLFYGSADGVFNPLSGAANRPDWTYNTGRRFGYTVSTGGDINGDGFDDVVVGDHFNSTVLSNGGMVAVFFGSASGLSAVPDWRVYGDQGNSDFGISVSGGIDFNGDGYSDIVIGADRYTNGELEEGKVFVFYGAAGGLADDDFDNIARVDEASWTAESDLAGARMGWSVAGGSVNGDGFSDLLVGAPWGATATLYLGGASGLAASAAWSVSEGTGSYSGFGRSVAFAGDTNGDGYGDLIVSRPATGQAFVYFGSAALPSATPDWTITGASGSELAVATAGDLNSDSYADILVGFSRYDNAFIDAGAVMVYYGSASGPRSDGSADMQFEGDEAYAYFGQSVAALGDVEGDGLADFIVGVPNASHFASGRGLAFAYLSSPTPPHVTIDPHPVHDPLIVNEAGTTTDFTVVLDTQPLADVVIDIISGDTSEATVSPASLRFTAFDWNVPRTVTVTGVDDLLADGTQSSVISFNVSSGDSAYDAMAVATRRVTVTNDDCACVTVTPALSPPLVTTETGQSASFSVSLDADPEGLLTINIDNRDETEGAVSTTQLFFDSNNFQTPQTVTVTGVDDSELDGDITYLIVNTASSAGPYNGVGVSNVFVTNLDDDFTVTSKQIAGSALRGQFGRAVSGVGDVNGDGWDDVIVGAPGEENGQYREGRAYLYYGSPAGISGIADWSAESDSNNPYFGGAVAAAGDVNNDGFADVLISAYRFTDAFNREGKVYLYYGSASGLAATPAWTMTGGQARAYFGRAIASAGDVNGDGFDDILVGASGYDTADRDAGRVYLYLGSATGPALSPSWISEGDKVLTSYGNAVAGAGDINGDGFDDILIGASKYDSAGSEVGRAYLYLGGPSGPAAVADWSSGGDAATDFYGSAVSSAGDVNGDGFADVLIGANLDTPSIFGPRWDAGRLFVFYGSATGLAATPDWVFDNEQSYAQLGGSVSSLGDINGDGFDDILAGATHYNIQQADEGAALLFLGSASGPMTTSITLSAGQGSALFGTSVSGAGDVDGDGMGDFIVGANLYDTSAGTDAGAAFLYLSRTLGVVVTAGSALQTSENLTSVTFTVALATPPSADVTIPLSSSDSSEGSVSPSQLVFTPSNWFQAQTVTVTGADDGVLDGDVLYSVTLAPAVSADPLYAGVDGADVTLLNLDNELAQVSINITDASATEVGANEATLVVSRAGSTLQAMTVYYTIGGTATAGVDYFALSGAVSLGAGEASASITLLPMDDLLAEGPETVVLTLSPDAAYDIGGSNSATITIVDNDNPGITVTPVTGLETTEAGGVARFSVVLESAPAADVSIGLSSSDPSEGKLLVSSLLFTPSNWNSAQTVTVVGQDDGAIDGDVAYSIVTAAASSADARYNTMAVADVSLSNRDDEPLQNLTLVATDGIAAETGPDGAYLTVTRVGSTAASLTVYYSVSGTAEAGSDYQSLSGSVTLAAGNEQATIAVTPIDDALAEGDETITVTLDAHPAYIVDQPGSDTVTLIDNDQSSLPVANFTVDQVVGEGKSFQLKVVLDRPAVGLTLIPYTVGGTASTDYGVDHYASDGTFTLYAGEREALGSTTQIIDDGAGDDGETITFTMGPLTNALAGAHDVHTITVVEANQPPSVMLYARQNSGPFTRTIVIGGGETIVEAIVTDPNPGFTFNYDWSLSDNALVDTWGITTDRYFGFSADALSPGLYNLHVTVTDLGSPPLSAEAELLLNVVSAVPVLSAAVDSDGDGTPDSIDSFNDEDSDGIADYLDSSLLPKNRLQQLSGQSDSYVMVVDPGMQLRLGDVAFAAGADGAQVSPEDIASYGDNLGGPGLGAVDSVPNVGGYFDFEIYGLTRPGDSASIVIPQLQPIPEGAWYRKYSPLMGWRDFVADANNSLASAPGEPGLCPIPSDAVYTPGLTAGHHCIRLTIEDGGPNDSDGAVNSVIEDPGQVVVAATAPPPVVAAEPERKPYLGGLGAVDWVAMFSLVCLWGWRRLRYWRHGTCVCGASLLKWRT